MTQPRKEEWRIGEALKTIRQGRKCEIPVPDATGDRGCGAWVYTAEAWERHVFWHSLLLNKISEIDGRFEIVYEYVTGDGGVDDRIAQLRADATTAINSVRSDATAAIIALQNRVTALESLLGK